MGDYLMGIALPPGFTALVRWIEKNRPDLNIGRCPSQPDGKVRAVVTIVLENPDEGGAAAANLLTEAAQAVGLGGPIPAQVQLWPTDEEPPAEYVGAGTVPPGVAGDPIAEFTLRFPNSQPVAVVLRDSGEGACVHVIAGGAVLGVAEIEVGGQRVPISLCAACTLAPAIDPAVDEGGGQ